MKIKCDKRDDKLSLKHHGNVHICLPSLPELVSLVSGENFLLGITSLWRSEIFAKYSFHMIKIIIKQSKQIETNKNWKPKIKEKEKKKNRKKHSISARMQDCIDKFRRVQAIKDLAQNYFQSFCLIRCNSQNVYIYIYDAINVQKCKQTFDKLPSIFFFKFNFINYKILSVGWKYYVHWLSKRD